MKKLLSISVFSLFSVCAAFAGTPSLVHHSTNRQAFDMPYPDPNSPHVPLAFNMPYPDPNSLHVQLAFDMPYPDPNSPHVPLAFDMPYPDPNSPHVPLAI